MFSEAFRKCPSTAELHEREVLKCLEECGGWR